MDHLLDAASVLELMLEVVSTQEFSDRMLDMQDNEAMLCFDKPPFDN